MSQFYFKLVKLLQVILVHLIDFGKINNNSWYEMETNQKLFLLVVLSSIFSYVDGLWCYQCVSTQPGCGDSFDWRWYTSYTCQHEHDKCVKITERKGADEIITRNCLSLLEYSRHDVPADKYEGCRPAAKDIQLAHYVNNSIKQLDIKRDYYDEVTWCFCEFDHFCNGGIHIQSFFSSCTIPVISLAALFLLH